MKSYPEEVNDDVRHYFEELVRTVPQDGIWVYPRGQVAYRIDHKNKTFHRIANNQFSVINPVDYLPEGEDINKYVIPRVIPGWKVKDK